MNAHVIHDLIIMAQAQVELAGITAAVCVLVMPFIIGYGITTRAIDKASL